MIDDILLYIFKYLSICDMHSCFIVNKKINALLNNQILWKTLLENDYPNDFSAIYNGWKTN